MKQLKRKRIQISVEFNSYESLLDTLVKIASDAQNNLQYDGNTNNMSKFEWFQEYITKEQPISEKVIDGKLIQTFSSKINRRKIES